jgi:hypothetical protein
MDGMPTWTLDQIAGLAFGVSGAQQANAMQHAAMPASTCLMCLLLSVTGLLQPLFCTAPCVWSGQPRLLCVPSPPPGRHVGFFPQRTASGRVRGALAEATTGSVRGVRRPVRAGQLCGPELPFAQRGWITEAVMRDMLGP